MDAPGEPPDASGVEPAAAFFGLWPRIAEPEPADGPRLIALSPDRPDPPAGKRDRPVRLG